MDIEKDSNREAFEAWFESRYDANFMQFALDLDMYVDKHTQTSWEAWQAAKAQAVQSKQDLLDRVNARWQLAHEQCAENWNTYSSAQMDAFDWVEQDIKELLWEAQEQANAL